MAESSFQKTTDKVITTLTDVFKKSPHLPQSIAELFVKISPLLALILGALFVLFGLGGLSEYPINGLITIIWGVLLLLAFSPLRSRKYAGWKLLFYADCVMVLSGLISFSLDGLIETLVIALLAFYLLFEINPYYK